MTTISIIDHPLGDGSLVYDVWVDGLQLQAVTEKDAEELAAKISAAVEAHTNETVTRHQFSVQGELGERK